TACTLRFLDQKILARSERTVESGYLPCGPGGRGILNGPSVQIHGRAISIEDFNEIILESGPGVAAAAIDLADHNTVGAGFYRRRRRNQESGAKKEKTQGKTQGERFRFHRQMKYPWRKSRAQTKIMLKSKFFCG